MNILRAICSRASVSCGFRTLCRGLVVCVATLGTAGLPAGATARETPQQIVTGTWLCEANCSGKVIIAPETYSYVGLPDPENPYNYGGCAYPTGKPFWSMYSLAHRGHLLTFFGTIEIREPYYDCTTSIHTVGGWAIRTDLKPYQMTAKAVPSYRVSLRKCDPPDSPLCADN